MSDLRFERSVQKGLLDGLRGHDKIAKAFVGPFSRGPTYPPDVPSTDQLLKMVTGPTYACVSLLAGVSAGAAIPEMFVRTNRRGQKFRRPTRALTRTQKEHLKHNSPYLTDTESAEQVLEHPLLDLLNNPNPLYTRHEFFEAWSIWSDTARFYAYIIKNQLGVPVELWPLPPGPMKVVLNDHNLIDHWVWGYHPRTVRFETDEILFHRRIGAAKTPLEQIFGSSPLAGIHDTAEASTRIIGHLNTLLRNRAVPEITVQVKGARDEKLQRVLQAYKDAWGDGNLGGLAVVGEEVDIKPMGFNPRDMQQVETAKAIREMVCNAFGVPIGLFTADNVARANAEAAHYQLAKYAITPRLGRTQETINKVLVPMFEPSKRIFITFRDAVPDDKQFAVEENVAYVGAGIITRNEARETIGRKPMSGADELVAATDNTSASDNSAAANEGE